MLRVGLTGGIGSGKSTVARLFATRAIPIIDTDAIAHELVKPKEAAYDEIVKQFGHEIVDADGALDRGKLRTRVFNNPLERERLESILHPRIRTEAKRRLNNIDAAYGVIVVPLLVETGFDGLIDRVLLVDCDEALQIERAAQRSGMTPTEIQKIMATQATREQRLMRADDVIENNSGLVELEQKVKRLHERYLALARKV